jgi:hypothetical protein
MKPVNSYRVYKILCLGFVVTNFNPVHILTSYSLLWDQFYIIAILCESLKQSFPISYPD